MTTTVYEVRDSRRTRWRTTDAEAADRLSRAGLTVTARTRGQR